MTLFMPFFGRPALQKLTRLPILQPSRHLINFSTPKPEYVFGNFAAIFAVIASLDKHGLNRHPNLEFFCPPFWLDEVHQHYLGETWGQNKDGLPKIARDMFNDMYPQHNVNNLLTWEQIQKLRLTGLHLLEHHYKIPVRHGVPKVQKIATGGLEISLNGKPIHLLEKNNNSHFYIWYKKPKPFILNGVIQKSSVEIYRNPPDVIPKDMDIIVLGSGLSVVWIAKHFTNAHSQRRIICLKYPHLKIDTDIPANKEVDYKKIITLNSKVVQMSMDSKFPHMIEVFCPETHKTYQGPFFAATGVETPMEDFTGIGDSQITAPHQWLEKKWVAAKNIPIGSLMESLVRWFSMTDNLKWGFEPQSYYETKHFFETVIGENFSKTLNLDFRYLQALGHAVIHIDNPVTEQQLPQLLFNVYQDVYKPSSEQSELFKKELNLLLNQRSAIFQENINSTEFTP